MGKKWAFREVHGNYMNGYQETSQVSVVALPLCQLPEARSIFGSVREALLCYLCGGWQGLEHRLDILERCLDPGSARGPSSDLPSSPSWNKGCISHTYFHLEGTRTHHANTHLAHHRFVLGAHYPCCVSWRRGWPTGKVRLSFESNTWRSCMREVHVITT